MERTLVLALLSLALAGCTAPEPAGPGSESALGGVYVPPADEPAATLPLDDAGAAALAGSPTPAAASDPGAASASRASPAASTSSPSSSAPAPSGPGAADPARAGVPRLRPGDGWTYRGVNSSGARFEEVRRVLDVAQRGNVPVYVIDVTVGDRRLQEDVTQAGLNTINGTGFVTELLRFPLEAGANWSFAWSDDGSITKVNPNDPTRTDTAGWHHWLRGDVQVLGAAKLPLLSGNWDTLHLRCTLTTGLGSYTREIVLEYWYAPAAKAIVRVESTQNGATTWSELAEARV
ncbi:MAG TPA: hypothetical protein VGR28_14160 [Candidatus Thermoplasmatota archaeon]|jgi:hypothetical protein|nr:hypothetical protein [Candidatus Thermoplasmatota archaeon]